MEAFNRRERVMLHQPHRRVHLSLNAWGWGLGREVSQHVGTGRGLGRGLSTPGQGARTLLLLLRLLPTLLRLRLADQRQTDNAEVIMSPMNLSLRHKRAVRELTHSCRLWTMDQFDSSRILY
jgi:hypothetical protein